MNTSNLYVGMRIRNYIEFCKLVGELDLGGDSKKAQIMQWERFVKFHKEGYSLIIDEIYDIKKPKLDKRSLGNAKKVFIEHIKTQILHYLATTNRKNGISLEAIRHQELFKLLGMTNGEYTIHSNTSDEAIEAFVMEYPNQFSKFDVRKFYSYTKGKNKRLVTTALNSLEREFIILWDERHMIHDGKTLRLSTTGDDGEEGKIMAWKYKVSKMLKCQDEYEIHNRGLGDKFYEILNNALLKEYGWIKCYKVFSITFDADLLPEQIKRYEKELSEIENEKLTLNDKVHANIVETAMKRYMKAEEAHRIWEERMDQMREQVWGDIIRVGLEEEPFQYHEDYPKNIENLANLLVSLN